MSRLKLDAIVQNRVYEQRRITSQLTTLKFIHQVLTTSGLSFFWLWRLKGNSPIEVLFWIILSSFHSVHCRIVNFQCIFRSEVLGASGTLVAEAIREVYGLNVVAHLRPLGPAL